MNRGAGAQDVFVVADDYEAFLELAHEASVRWGLRIHAAALMSNHFHLLIEDVDGLLSRGMRHILGVYTQRFNRRHKRDGSLFRGRFRSRLVQTEEYLAELVRYIHLNPVRARLADTAAAYPWSSHRHYLGPAALVPDWLCTGETFRRFGGDNAEGRAWLDEFVHQPVPEAQSKLLAGEPWRPLLGTEQFIIGWRERLRGASTRDTPEVPERRRLVAVEAEEVLSAVVSHFGVQRSELHEPRRRRGNIPRAMTLVLLIDWTRATHAQVAQALGMSPSSVASLARRHRSKFHNDQALSADIAAIERALSKRRRASSGSL
jgi:REP element-mobilizing transposase RayT